MDAEGSWARVRKDPFWFRYIGGMTREEFIKVLEEKGYSYEMERNKIVVTHEGTVYLNSLETLPSGVEFRNGGYVFLDSLKTLSPGVEFRNVGSVHSDSLFDSLFGGWFNNWDGNIKGIASNRLLNKMIADGLFDR